MKRYYVTLGLVIAVLFAFFAASPSQAGQSPVAAPQATPNPTSPPPAPVAAPVVTVSNEFVQRTILCTVTVFAEPDLNFPTTARIRIGQRWFVNLTPIRGVDRKTWHEIYVAGPNNGFIPASCVAKY
jgi:hypothetical protein